jgi:hypothetical protein
MIHSEHAPLPNFRQPPIFYRHPLWRRQTTESRPDPDSRLDTIGLFFIIKMKTPKKVADDSFTSARQSNATEAAQG